MRRERRPRWPRRALLPPGVSNALRDRKFLWFHPRLAQRSGPFWSPRAGTDASSGLLNRQETGGREGLPRHNAPQTPIPCPTAPPRAHPAPAAGADMKLRKRLRKLPRSVGREGTAPRPSRGASESRPRHRGR